jgi:hypothetical protein
VASRSTARWRRVAIWSIALSAIFAFRLLYGLSRELFFEDETQIFLMGLRYYATGAWPHFGADVVWTKSEIPGALQALLVGVPFNVLPVPEAPYLLLNMLSMLALAGFAWYITARLPEMPQWLVWGWLMTVPWTIEFSTHIINPSYLLAAALVFFIGFFEAVPVFRLGKIPVAATFALMGAAIAWIAQIHMSWPLLIPYVGIAAISQWRSGLRPMAGNLLGLAGGLLTIGVFLLPTLLVYGLRAGSGGTFKSVVVHPVNPWIVVTTLARLFSFASLEIWRFIATDDSCCCGGISGLCQWPASSGWLESGSRYGCFGNGSGRNRRFRNGARSSGSWLAPSSSSTRATGSSSSRPSRTRSTSWRRLRSCSRHTAGRLWTRSGGDRWPAVSWP